jgi:dihydroorotase/N-acyl-D-amino-acid deacylase
MRDCCTASERVVQVVLLFLSFQTVTLGQTSAALDIVIRNGHVIDGTGAPWYQADVGIRDGRIVAIGKLNQSAKVTYDATGLAVAPGFIDMLGQSEFNILVDNRAASKILQGVTTEVTGEGGSIAPLNERMIGNGGVRNGKTPFKQFGVEPSWRTLAEYFSLLENKIHPAINIATFVGPEVFETTSSGGMTVPQLRLNSTR